MTATNFDLTRDVDEPLDRSCGVNPRECDPADLVRLNRMIDEWGRQSFPASDPPPNW